jgi:drug/metabolite transporter (DMT)-like permease
MRVRSGFAPFLACVLTWGSIGVVVRNISLPSPVIVFFRLAFGMLVVLGWMAARRTLGDLRPRGRAGLLAASGAILAVHWVTEFEAFKRLDVSAAILIIFIGPVLTTALAPFVVRERIRPVAVAALAAAFGGIALITVPDIGDIDGVGVAVALASAVLFAALILADKILAEIYPAPAIVVWQPGIAGVLLAPALIGAPGRGIARALLLMLMLGAAYTGILGILFFRAVRVLQTQQISVLFYLEPASAVLYAWWLLAERPGSTTLAGGALIVAAGVAIILGDRLRPVALGVPEPVAVEEAPG